LTRVKAGQYRKKRPTSCAKSKPDGRNRRTLYLVEFADAKAMIDEYILRILEAVPVLRAADGVRYVRTSDIPSTARPAFERWAAGIHTLDVPGEQPGDAFPEEEYREWLRVLKPMHPQHPPTPLEKEE